MTMKLGGDILCLCNVEFTKCQGGGGGGQLSGVMGREIVKV